MRQQTAIIALGIAVLMVVTLWATFHVGPSEDEVVSAVPEPRVTTERPARSTAVSVRATADASGGDTTTTEHTADTSAGAADGASSGGDEGAATTADTSANAGEAGDAADAGQAEGQQQQQQDQSGGDAGAGAAEEDADAPLPLHITGRWTDALHAVQRRLVEQTLGDYGAPCLLRNRDPHSPPPSPADAEIRHNLRQRKACNDLLTNVPWTREDLLRELKHFVRNVYPNRPIKFNALGMRLSHSFGCYFVTKMLQPDNIIENGVHLGQSTWLFRQAAPDAKIWSLDPRADMQYWDPKATYFVDFGQARAGYDVRPFRDFREVDWETLIPNRTRSLVLFDDHQSMLKRLWAAQAHGFRHVLSDDNWGPLQGDNYSIKQICDESGGLALRDPAFRSKRVLMCDNFHMADRFITLEEHREFRKKLLAMLRRYWEAPPVLSLPCQMEFTKFGHTPKKDNPENIDYTLPKPSLQLLKWMHEALIAPPVVQTQEEFDDVGLKAVGKAEFSNYANFGYVELRE